MVVLHVGHARVPDAGTAANGTWFGRMDPRAKLVGVLIFVVVTALLTRTDLLLVSGAIALVFAGASMVSPRRLVKAYLMALPFILMASVSVFLFGGIERGFDMWLRVSASVLALQVLALGTETFDLFSGLRRLKLPAVLTTLTMLTYRYLLLFMDEYDRMKIARKARGFSGGRSLLDRYGFRVLSDTAGMLLVRSVSRADRIYEALTARGFNEDMSYWRRSALALSDASFLVALIAASGTLLAVQLGVAT
jgi:cobalt/nickel transport system permease protein